jgi:tetratricopeptide (TPR) repeat protein
VRCPSKGRLFLLPAANAQKFAEEAVKLDPYRLSPYLELIEIGARSKKFDLADKAYGDAQKAFGDNLELGLAKGGRLLAEGKVDEALSHLQNMLKTLDLAEVHRDIGKVYMKKNEMDKAVESLKKASEKALTRSPGTQANCLTWLGRALAQAGDHKSAAEAYSQSLAATTEFTSTYYWLGLSLIELTQIDAAKDAFQRYMKIEPSGPYAEKIKAKMAEL